MSKESPDRPALISVICILGFIAAPLTMALAFLSSPPRVPEWVAACCFFSGLAQFICMIGLWNMRRWGVIGYTAICVFNLGILAARGTELWVITSALWYTLKLTIAFLFFRRMRW